MSGKLPEKLHPCPGLKLSKADPASLNELGQEQWEWARRRGLEQARERLGGLIAKNGLDPRKIARRAVIFHSVYLLAAVLLFSSGVLLLHLACSGMFVLGPGFIKWVYPLCGIIVGIPFLLRWIRNRW